MRALANIVWLDPDYITATYFHGSREDGEDCPEPLRDAAGLGLWRKQPNGSWQVVWRKLLKKGHPGPAAFCRCPDGIYLAHFDVIVDGPDEEPPMHSENLLWWRLGRDKLHLVGKTRLPRNLRYGDPEVLAIDCERAYFEGTVAEGKKQVPVLASLSRTTGRCRVHARISPPYSVHLQYDLKISPDRRNLLIALYSWDYSSEHRVNERNLKGYSVVPFLFSGEVRGRVIDVLSGQVR
jgi:hypothetical protein